MLQTHVPKRRRPRGRGRNRFAARGDPCGGLQKLAVLASGIQGSQGDKFVHHPGKESQRASLELQSKISQYIEV